MLRIYFGNSGKDFNPDSWFKSRFDRKNLLTDFSKRLLKEVAHCEVLGENLIVSDVLGPIDPNRMGTGCKAALYLMYEENKQRYGRVGVYWCGDNLIPFIREIGEHKDVEIDCDRLIPLFTDGYNGSVQILNTGNICSNWGEFFEEYCEAGL